jgi:branched-chain amino acid transport system permease protein
MQTQTIRTLLSLGAAAALLSVGALVGSYPAFLAGLAMVNVIAAVGLNLLVGNSGQISLCHSSFMAVGAYSSSLLASGAGLPFWAAIPAGAAIAALMGGLLGMPARRLGGIYLALATLGFLQIVQIVVEEFSDYTGGVRGLNTAKPTLFGSPLTSYGVYSVVAIVCVLAVWLAINIKHSRVGREFDAVRLSPHAAQALGISVARVKLTAFALSAGYAGLAGGLFAILVGFIDPNEFGIASSLRHLTYIVVGGLGSIGGSILGAALLSGLPELLRPVKEYTDLAAALILLAALLFMPNGLAATWQRLTLKPKAARRGVPA